MYTTYYSWGTKKVWKMIKRFKGAKIAITSTNPLTVIYTMDLIIRKRYQLIKRTLWLVCSVAYWINKKMLTKLSKKLTERKLRKGRSSKTRSSRTFRTTSICKWARHLWVSSFGYRGILLRTFWWYGSLPR